MIQQQQQLAFKLGLATGAFKALKNLTQNSGLCSFEFENVDALLMACADHFYNPEKYPNESDDQSEKFKMAIETLEFIAKYDEKVNAALLASETLQEIQIIGQKKKQ